MRDVMVDLETLGASPGCALLSIGAVAFDPETGQLGEEHYAVVNTASCVCAGLTYDGATLDWWSSQSPEAREVLKLAHRSDATPLLAALSDFALYLESACGGEEPRLWGNGSDFDNAILAFAFRAARVSAPWKFWNNRCYRTLKNLHVEVSVERTGTHHNALDDARTQAVHALKIFERMRAATASR